jgi:hypothetical protein
VILGASLKTNESSLSVVTSWSIEKLKLKNTAAVFQADSADAMAE